MYCIRIANTLSKLLCAAVALGLLFTSCKKDNETIIASIKLDRSALYIDTPSTTEQITFSTERAAGMSMTGCPKGWNVEFDLKAGVIRVTSPAADDAEAEKHGTVYFYIYSETSTATQFTIYVSSIYPTSLAEQRSNCYIITENNASYSIPVNRKGESDEPLEVEQVKLLWQGGESLISYIEMLSEEQVSFHVESGSKGKFLSGNALLGGYNAKGELLWTWHLWITPTQPQAIGRYMDRNLGADYAKHATQEEILHSYGTYYQWGRMTPFIGPKSYNCAASQSQDLVLINSTSYTYITYQIATEQSATTDYAVSHPLVYLLSDESLAYDWNAEHPTALWTSDRKSLYDPCPKGWRVADNFDDLAFAGDRTADLATLESQFGWELTDGENTLFFPAAGRRSWVQGLITNVNDAETPKPWIGYYWSATTEANHLSRALHFTLDTEDPEASLFDKALASPRANGMQVRCIKE